MALPPKNMPPMPDCEPVTFEMPLPGVSGEYSQAQVYHPIVKTDHGPAVDVYVRDGIAIGKIWQKKDHPNLSKLPANAPRAVRAIYRADGQLAMMRSTDAFTHPFMKAMDAWVKYWRAIEDHNI